LGDVVFGVSSTFDPPLITDDCHHLRLLSSNTYIFVLVYALALIIDQIEFQGQIFVITGIAMIMVDQSSFCFVLIWIRQGVRLFHMIRV